MWLSCELFVYNPVLTMIAHTRINKNLFGTSKIWKYSKLQRATKRKRKQTESDTNIFSLPSPKKTTQSFFQWSFIWTQSSSTEKSYTNNYTKTASTRFWNKTFKEVYKKDYKTNLMILPLYQMIHIHLSWACAFHSFLVWHLKMKSEIPDLFQGIQQLITFQNKH